MIDLTKNPLTVLARLGSDPMSGVYLQPRGTKAAIARMQTDAERDLGEMVPESYSALLRVTNGVQINGAYFKSAETLVAENLDLSTPEVIVLGDAGNHAWFVFDRRDRRFHTVNLGFPDERFASFDTLDELLTSVMREQQVV